METFTSYEEAAKTVQGTKIRLVMAKKMFAVPGLGVDDMFAVADAAIYEAFKTWDPTMSKFNTHVHNMINYKLADALNEMNGRWKVIEQITYEQSYYHKETYKTVKATGMTLNEKYNLENDLDGSDAAKKRVNRNIWNGYLQYLAYIKGYVTLINESQFQTADTEEFNIMDTAESLYIGENDSTYKDDDDMLRDLHALPLIKQKMARMLLDGATIAEVAEEMKMTQAALLKVYAPEDKKVVKVVKYTSTVKRSKTMSPEKKAFLARMKEKEQALYA